jgi:hypothetical protein
MGSRNVVLLPGAGRGGGAETRASLLPFRFIEGRVDGGRRVCRIGAALVERDEERLGFVGGSGAEKIRILWSGV